MEKNIKLILQLEKAFYEDKKPCLKNKLKQIL